jgi:hypothetical protein
MSLSFNRLRTLCAKHRGCTPSEASRKNEGTGLKTGHYKEGLAEATPRHNATDLEMAAEFAEAGEDDEFAGAGGNWFVLHVPSVLMRNVDGV